MRRRSVLLAGAVALSAPPVAARAQEVTRDVRLIVPFAPGGSVDIIGRLLAEGLPPLIGGRTVVVENRTGAGGLIGLQAVATAAPDGHTLCVGSGTAMSVAPVIPGMSMPINPDRDLAPIISLVGIPMVLVAWPGVPYRTLPEMIAYGRANPGRIIAGTAGPGTSPHLMAARIANEAGIEIEFVPYRGGAPALLDLVAGRIHIYVSLITESIGQIRQGAVRAIASATTRPLPDLPDLPLINAVLPGYTGSSWYGLVGPAGLPPPWIDFWAERIRRLMAHEAFRRRVTDRLFEVTASTTDAFRTQVQEERRIWSAVIRAANIRITE